MRAWEVRGLLDSLSPEHFGRLLASGMRPIWRTGFDPSRDLVVCTEDRPTGDRSKYVCWACEAHGFNIYPLKIESDGEGPAVPEWLSLASHEVHHFLHARNRTSCKPTKAMIEILEASGRFARREIDEAAAWERVRAAYQRERRGRWWE